MTTATEKEVESAVTASRRLLASIDEQIKYAEVRRSEQRGKEIAQIPSRNQEFFYVTDSNGVLVTHQDADFVACQVYIISNAGQFFVGVGLEFSMEDLSSSRTFTYADAQYLVTTPRETVNRVEIGVLAPQGRMDYVPLAGIAGYQSENNADYWYDLPAEYLVPRGGVVRFRVRQPGGTNVFVNSGTDVARTVVLGGYKVY